ncbi:MAG: MBL fold metallo-hydrolase [Phycisphaerales bacterium]
MTTPPNQPNQPHTSSPAPHTTPSVAPVVQVFPLGDFQTNCMIVTAGEPTSGKPCWIVDCGYQPEPLLDAVQQQGLIVERIMLTHAHADHMAGLFEARSRFPDAKIYLNPIEESWMNDPMLNLSAALGLSITGPALDGHLEHNQTHELDGLTWRIAHTPGHSPGSVSIIHEPSKTALVGDTLFNGSIGRTDFPGSSFEQLEQSIREHLYTLDPETVCYPGHGPKTTVGRERTTNPFVSG